MLPGADYMTTAQDAIYDAFAAILGLTANQAKAMIRYSWPDGRSVKFTATPDDDVCYIRLTAFPKPATGHINAENIMVGDAMKKRYNMHICVRADCIFYGPHAFDYSHQVFIGVHDPKARAVLAPAKMAAIPDEDLPAPSRELVDGRWYTRYDVGINFYMLVVYQNDVDALTEAPNIVIQKG